MKNSIIRQCCCFVLGVLICNPIWGQVSRQASSTHSLRQCFQLVETGQVDQAIKKLEILISKAPDSPSLYPARVLLGQLHGDFKTRQKVYLNRKVVDTVVLVSDTTAYMEAISGWTDEQFYPVLIEDSWFAPIFINAFKPKSVVRWTKSVKGKQPLNQVTQQLKKLVAQHNHKLGQNTANAPGMVVMDSIGGQRWGGIALGLGRGQPIAGLTFPKKYNDRITLPQAVQFNRALFSELTKWKLNKTHGQVGLTLAGNYPYRYTIAGKKGDFAVDDLLGRDQRGVRIAVTGRLVGGATQSIYLAMCSLFLQPKNMLLFDDYSNRSGTFTKYQFGQSHVLLKKRLKVSRISGKSTTPAMFRKMTSGNPPFDLVWVNSDGLYNYFNVRGRAYTDDLPLNHASAFYMIHSFSLRLPTNSDSLAGRVLAGGGYWWFGSIHEPYLPAFVQPTGMAAKFAAGTPLAFACRQLPGGQFSQPWKLMLVGDPLFGLRDQPAVRVTIDLPNTRRVVVSKEAKRPVGLRMRDAIFSGDEAEALKLAQLCMKQTSKMYPADLNRAAWLLNKGGQVQLLAVVPPSTLKKAPIARLLVWRSGLEMFDKVRKAGSYRASQLMLGRLLEHGRDEKPLTLRLKHLHALALKTGNEKMFYAFLNQQERRKLPVQSIKAIKSMRAQLAGDNQEAQTLTCISIKKQLNQKSVQLF